MASLSKGAASSGGSLEHPLGPAGRCVGRGNCGGAGDGGNSSGCAGADGLGIVLEEGFPDDAPRIILAGIILFPVDIIDVDPHFFLDLFTGAGGHPPDFLDQVGQLLGIFGQPLGTDHQDADDQQQEELRAVDSKHFRKITLSGLPVTIPAGRGPEVSPYRVKTATILLIPRCSRKAADSSSGTALPSASPAEIPFAV